MERNQISSLTATSRSIFCLLHSIHRFIAYCAVRFRLQEHFHSEKIFRRHVKERRRGHKGVRKKALRCEEAKKDRGKKRKVGKVLHG